MSEESLFHEALSRASAERAAFLDQACTGQPELRSAVEALLAAHEASGSFLSEDTEATGAYVPSAGDDVPPSIPQPGATDYRLPTGTGAVIANRYTLVEKIGEGGMGEVWVAEQTEPVKRRVALKLIKAGMDSKAVLQRFEKERQALALMDHPNIAKVLDGGMIGEPGALATGGSARQPPVAYAPASPGFGLPFFVMELVNGLPLTKFCDDAKLAPKERLELFVPICQAVQHAHQKGIVHRDLKPSNILVTLIDAKPVPKVIDFGVAKATAGKLTDESLSTHFGAVVGTLEYMSPEQAGYSGQDIDTRADIYSLGVILYELLTGLRPFDAKRLKKAALTEMIRIIQEEEPSKPSTRLSTDESLPSMAALRQTEPKKLMAMLRGELDWVVMKCLEKRRDRRYETANGLAYDIQRYLADEIVEARPPSVGYRLRKFARKHRAALASLTAIGMLLVAGLSASLWQMFRAIAAEDQANENAQQARQERDAKELALNAEQRARADEIKARQQAFAALRSMTDEVVEKKFAQGAVLTDDDRAFLRAITAQFEAFAALKGDDAVSRGVRAHGRLRVGIMRSALGEFTEAEKDYDQALSIFEQLTAENPSQTEFRQYFAHSHLSRGNLLHRTGRLAEAEKDFDQALSIQKQLAADFPSQPQFRHYLAYSHNNRGLLLSATGRFKEAEQEYDQALSLRKRLAADFPARPEFGQDLATGYNNRGALLSTMGRLQEAAQDYDQALSIYQQLAAEFPSRFEFRRELAGSHYNRGLLLRERGQLQEAQKAYDKALSIRKQLAAEFPSQPEFREELATSLGNRGLLLSASGQLQEAEEDYDQAVSICKQLAADFPARPEFRRGLALSHFDRGLLLSGTGRLQEAEQDCDQALSIYSDLAAKFPSRPEFRQELAVTYNGRGILLRDTGRLEQAQNNYDQAVNICKQLAADLPARSEFRHELAKSYINRGILMTDTVRLKEAEKDYDQALGICKQLAADFPARPEFGNELASSYISRGLLLQNTGRFNEAEKDYNLALNSCKQLAAEFPFRREFRQLLASSHNNRGNLLRDMGRPVEAEKDYVQALSIYKQLATDFPSLTEFRHELAKSHNNRGLLLSDTGRRKEAEQDYDQALSIWKQLSARFSSQPDFRQALAKGHTNRGNLLSAAGRLEEAEKDYDRDLNIRKQLATDFPSRLEFRRGLATSYNNRGTRLGANGRSEEAARDFDQALSIRKQLAADFPNQPDLRHDLGGTYVNLAILQRLRGNWAAAKQLLLEGRPHHLAALKANPKHPTYRQFYRNHLQELTTVHAELLEPEDAVGTAETRRDLGWNAPADAYDAACLLSSCIPIVAQHDKLDDKQRQEAAQFYGDAALKLLREAVSKGYKDVVHMKKDAALDPLRQRKEFQKLVAQLEGK
jgi:tetratricopeptide (TPR) repeat protein